MPVWVMAILGPSYIPHHPTRLPKRQMWPFR